MWRSNEKEKYLVCQMLINIKENKRAGKVWGSVCWGKDGESRMVKS